MIELPQARQALETIGPLLDQAEESVISRALLSHRNGTLTPEDSMALWARLAGLREVPNLLRDVVASSERRLETQMRAAISA